MTDWFRSWHGAPTDAKWRTIAKRAKVATSLAVAIAWALMDRASQCNTRGSIEGFDAETLADFMDCEPDEIEAVVAAMRHKGVLSGDVFTAWERRQPQREDNSAERAKAWRVKQKLEQLLAERDAEIMRFRASQPPGERSQPNGDETEGNRRQQEERERSRTQPNANDPRVEENRLDNYAATRERERARLDHLEAELRRASGLVNDQAPSLADVSPILGLIDAGFDLDEEILPVIRAKPRKRVVHSWNYYVGAIRDARNARVHAGAARTHTRDGPGARPTRGVASALAGIESFHREAEVG